VTKSNDDDLARRARADAIRRARDVRNAEIERSVDRDAAVTPAPTDESIETVETKEEGTPQGETPNYVDLINRQMRRQRGKPKQP